ncbi:hypothetical protein EDD18DRAFT_1356317 [Armillaria luteobubalina]|uniref:Uncharacterized protein n=1 Tax=Armillaria luteobubalina TaxID=153913 RepID=A0AA39TLC6_9AGAR|nr:hypothetical protein EDD18DRAFT_1356317 [Armillaria luteobubalina]
MAKQFKAETDEIKEEILVVMEELHEEILEVAGKRSPTDYLEAIDQAPVLLQHFIQEIAVETGWWFSVIAGGPLPTDSGNIHTHSFHIGHDFLVKYVAFSIDPEDADSCC